MSGAQSVFSQAYRGFLDQDKDSDVPPVTLLQSLQTHIHTHTELWCEVRLFAVLSGTGLCCMMTGLVMNWTVQTQGEPSRSSLQTSASTSVRLGRFSFAPESPLTAALSGSE